MIDLLRILLFGTSIVLTPAPIDIDGTVELTPPKPLTAITDGAALYIDVTSMIRWPMPGVDIKEQYTRIKTAFPAGTIDAQLVADDHSTVLLRYGSGLAMGKTVVELPLTSPEGVPTDRKFGKVILQSRIPLHGVKIRWENYSM